MPSAPRHSLDLTVLEDNVSHQYLSPFAVKSQAFLLFMHTAFVTKVSTRGPRCSHSSILHGSVLIYIFLGFPITNYTEHFSYRR